MIYKIKKTFLVLIFLTLIFYSGYLITAYNQIHFNYKVFFYYFLLPVFLFITLIIVTVHRNQVFFINTLIILSSFAISIIFFEIFLFLGKDKIHINFLNNQKALLGTNFNSKSYFDQIISERKKGKDIYPLIYSINNKIALNIDDEQIFSFGGVSNKEILWCNDEGIYQTFFSDRYGFNNPDYLWDNEINIFLLGDSYLMGHCVDFDKTIAQRIRKVYPKTINLSYSMGGALNMLGSLSEYSIDKKPSLVIKFIYTNDIVDTYKEYQFNITKGYLNDDFQYLINKKDKINKATLELAYKVINNLSPSNEKNNKPNVFEIDKSLLDKNKIFSKNLFFSLLKLKQTRNFLQIPSLKSYAKNYDYAIYSQAIDKIKNKTNEINSNFLVVILPSYKMIGKTSLQIDKTIEILQKLDIDYININKIFTQDDIDRNQIFKFPSSHYNEYGYKLVSDTVLQYLDQKQYFK